MHNVIFDIGNVLVDFHPIPYFSALRPEDHMELVCPLVFNEVWEEIDRGMHTCEEAKAIHLKRFPQYADQIVFIYDHWLEMMTLYDDMMDFFMACKRHGYRVYLLSNIGEESHRYLSKTMPFFDLADGMVLSYEEHVIKPEVKLYRILLERYGLDPKECVFFDDREENIVSARSLGIRVIQFINAEQAQKEAKLW